MRRKKGEEAVPAGGETGVPHYLAEDRKPLIQQYLRNKQKLNLSQIFREKLIQITIFKVYQKGT